MRHLLANVVAYAIATLLFVGAALFAWMRSSQLVLSDERTLLARYEPAPAHEFAWRELGADAYARNCARCHGRDGAGWDQYPGLAGAAHSLGEPNGRAYLIDLHLHGLASDRWGAPMPRMRHLQDVEIAAVLNYVITRFAPVAADSALLFTPGEVAERRGQRQPAPR